MVVVEMSHGRLITVLWSSEGEKGRWSRAGGRGQVRGLGVWGSCPTNHIFM